MNQDWILRRCPRGEIAPPPPQQPPQPLRAFLLSRTSRPSLSYESTLNIKEMSTKEDRFTPTTFLTNATATAVPVGAFSMTWLQEQAKQALIMNQYWILRTYVRRKATPPPATFPTTGEPVVQASCRRSEGAFSSRHQLQPSFRPVSRTSMQLKYK